MAAVCAMHLCAIISRCHTVQSKIIHASSRAHIVILLAGHLRRWIARRMRGDRKSFSVANNVVQFEYTVTAGHWKDPSSYVWGHAVADNNIFKSLVGKTMAQAVLCLVAGRFDY